MTDAELQFIDAGPEHHDAATRLAVEAFSVHGVSPEYWNALRSDPDGRYTLRRVGVLDGEVVAHTRLYWRTIRVRRAAIPAAVIGDVCIDPRCQGRGLGHRLLENTVDLLRHRGVLIARLGGRCSFYRQFGFFVAPDLRLILDAACCRKVYRAVDVECGDQLDLLRRDDQWLDLWRQTTAACFSCVERDAAFGRWLLQDRAFDRNPGKAVCTLHRRGELVGYALAGGGGDDLHVLEVCCRADDQELAAMMIGELARRSPQARRVLVAGPALDQLRRLMQARGVHGELAYWVQLPMAAILDLRALVEALLPVWGEAWTKQRRPLALAEEGGRFVLVDPGSSTARRIEPREVPAEALRLHLDRDELLRLLLGHVKASQLNLGFRHGLSLQELDLLGAVFSDDTGFFGGLENA